MLKFNELPEYNSKEWLSIKDLEGEVWKDIINYEGIYRISIYGRLKSLKFNKERIVKPHIITKKYHEAMLWKDGVKKCFHLHRLVAQAFVHNDNEKEFVQVNHKDENKNNNTASNLEWCDNKYNSNYGTRNKRMSNTLRGLPKLYLSKPVCQYTIDGEFIKEWQSAKEAARCLGYSHSSGIDKSCNAGGKIYKGYIWKRKDKNESID